MRYCQVQGSYLCDLCSVREKALRGTHYLSASVGDALRLSLHYPIEFGWALSHYPYYNSFCISLSDHFRDGWIIRL